MQRRPVIDSSQGNLRVGKKKRKRKKLKLTPKDPKRAILIEGHVLNEKTGVLEPYRKIVYWGYGC